MPKINIAGMSMYYLDRGHGTPVILIHGFLGNAFMWAPQISALEDSFRVISVDIWGHGNSDGIPEKTCSLTDIAKHILILTERLKIKKFIIVGHSVGGMLAGEMLLLAPHKIIATALLNTHLGCESKPTKKIFLDLLFQLESKAAFTTEITEKLNGLFFLPRQEKNIERLITAFQRTLEGYSQDIILGSIVPVGRMIFNRRNLLNEFVDVCHSPVIVICGQYDTVRKPAEAMSMAKYLNCEYKEIPDTAHTPVLESPKYVTNILVNFLNNVNKR